MILTAYGNFMSPLCVIVAYDLSNDALSQIVRVTEKW